MLQAHQDAYVSLVLLRVVDRTDVATRDATVPGLLEIRELWKRPVLPYSQEPELVPALDVVEDTLPDALGLDD